MDTIAAISTPHGIGGIAVIRVSGPNALSIVGKIFKGSKAPREIESHRVLYGKIFNPETEEVIDDVLLTVMKAPHSFTGEDVVEISCHGGLVIPRLILETLLKAGTRLANPGEFTERAFLNGKLDLVQAIGVKDLIEATSIQAVRLARKRLDGVLSGKFDKLKEQLIDILKDVEARVDFEEDVPPLDPNELEKKINEIISTIDDLVKRGEQGQKLFEGIRIVISGRPNVGKSTLFNRILNEERAIVTDIPGTTRDVISEQILLDGIPVRLMDTAGLRETEEKVELIGVNLALETARTADVILYVIDASAPLKEEDIEVLNKLEAPVTILVFNKIDKEINLDKDSLKDIIEERQQFWVSSLTGEGLEEFIKGLTSILKEKFIFSDDINLTGREKGLLLSAKSDLIEALKVHREGYPLDIVSFHLREAIFRLNEILGIGDIPERVLDKIFNEFCIGK